jgi:hypothetical protein
MIMWTFKGISILLLIVGATTLSNPAAVAQGKTCGGQTVTVDIGAGDSPTNGPDVIRGTRGDDLINGGGGATSSAVAAATTYSSAEEPATRSTVETATTAFTAEGAPTNCLANAATIPCSATLAATVSMAGNTGTYAKADQDPTPRGVANAAATSPSRRYFTTLPVAAFCAAVCRSYGPGFPKLS